MSAHGRDRRAGALLALAVAIVYLPLGLADGRHALFGLDFVQLHQHRLAFARAALAAGHLPGWYPRELDGVPFWSNLQSLPLIPTHLPLLLADPALGMTLGALLAAELAALFTFGYARRIGLDRVAASAAGWTFACAGFFASRLLAGHLPLLEAYPALPLLLWIAERPATAPALAALAAGTAAVALAGHPQLPVYAVATTAVYLLVRRGRDAGRPLAALLLGAATTLFAWWPMLRLAARSARTLGLDPPDNDLALPLGRLAALLLPWRDGWPALVQRYPAQPFHGYATVAYFWDSVSYVGLLPWGALVLLALWRRPPAAATDDARRLGRLFALLGLVALVTALPWRPTSSLGWPTVLRSPARQLYVTTFCLALALGAALQRLRASARLGSLRQRTLLVCVLLLLHALDLGDHARAFVRLTERQTVAAPEALARVQGGLGDGRVAIDHILRLEWNRRFDDVGFFDSLPLASSYAALLAAGSLPPGLNREAIDGGELTAGALAANSVRYVITDRERPDLTLRASLPRGRLYELGSTAPRAQLLAPAAARFVNREAALAELRREPYAGAGRILLPAAAAAPAPAGEGAAATNAAVRYERASSDEIRVRVTSGGGWLRVVESWDPGWQASLDDRPAAIVCADAHLLALALPPGEHLVRFTFHTPGALAGAAMSLLAMALLLLLLLATSRAQRTSRAP